jgi:hypothetical protein
MLTSQIGVKLVSVGSAQDFQDVSSVDVGLYKSTNMYLDRILRKISIDI